MSSGPFFDSHLTLGIVSVEHVDNTRHLQELGYHTVILGKLERTGITSVQVMRPSTLTEPDLAHQLDTDPEFRAFIREAMIEDGNTYLAKKAKT